MAMLKCSAAQVRRAIRAFLPWLGLAAVGGSVFILLQNASLVTFPLFRLQQRVIPAFFKTVVIDPGHGGEDDGASAHGLQEKTITLALAQSLAAQLNRVGITPVLTRTSDVYVSLANRVALALTVPDAIFLSLHCNYSDSPAAHGLEIYRCGAKSGPNQTLVTVSDGDQTIDQAETLLGQCLVDAVNSKLRVDNRGPKIANFFVVRNVDYPALLIECGFLTNADDAKRLNDSAYREALARALVSGILNYRSLVAGEGVKSVSNAAGASMTNASTK
jgi:N-acetylmuramoyl-L-alanine amidase